MSDIIQLLPDSVANQIAAGEVVQRPASVIKELIENSVDAGSTSIQVIVKDGGKAHIQVVDNGCGMSETDARMCFERHATSKIREANDLFAIRTMGFRGEAMASIAAVAEVDLKTRRHEDEVGTLISISGSTVVEQQPTACAAGSNISVKNLFFNVPARRKFLKSSSLELKHIISEFQRVALANPDISMSLNHNGADIYNLQASSLKQRIVGLMGRHMNQQLIDLKTDTTIVKLSGFIGKPESAKKSPGEQFFFVNNRFMKSAYHHKAVMNAYEKLLPPDSIPPYFIFFEVDPASIDVNIHPTKTEIKFEDERAIWQMLHAAVKESLGKFAVVPSIDFDNQITFDIPFFPQSAPVSPPEVEINPNFNPFDSDGDNRAVSYSRSTSSGGGGGYQHKPQSARGWQELLAASRNNEFEDQPRQTVMHHESSISSTPQQPSSSTESEQRFFQMKGKYILTSVKSGLMVIDQKRAHERILFEQYLISLSNNSGIMQQELFPVTVELSPADFTLILELKDELGTLGLDISNLGHNTIAVNGLPANIKRQDPRKLIDELIASFREEVSHPIESQREKVAISLSKAAAIPYGRVLTVPEMQDLIDKLFACQHPNMSPDGKLTLSIIETEELDKRLKA